jgi:hypothetical protein
LDFAQEILAGRAGAQPHVDAIELAQAAEAPLRRRDVGDRREPVQRGQDPGDLEAGDARACDQRELAALREPERLRRGGGKKHTIGSEQLGTVLEHELRLEDRRAQDVDPGQAQGALACGDPGLQLERGTRHRDAGKLRDPRVERLREAAAAAAHLEIGLAGERAHRGGDVAHRRAVDEVNAVAQRDAERDAGHRERHAPARAAREEKQEHPQHRLTILSA